MIADMHTHSLHSHDSKCRIEDMLLSQIEKGASIFAVTNHFDGESCKRYDIVEPIRLAKQCVEEINAKNETACEILTGVEISEGFWYPDVYERLKEIYPFDVIIGSVHLVKYKDMTTAYSGIDFSLYTKEVIEEYLDAYFDDVVTLMDTTDFDVLAHLTCPLRYITGKYKICVDMSRYDKKIEAILKRIIDENIALEVNTSSYDVLGDFFPSRDIIKKYYDMGGRLVTVGSDAHISEDACKCFDEAYSFLRQTGFENVYYYKNRKPMKIKL